LGDPLWQIDATLKAKGFSLSQPPSTYRGSIFPHGNEATIEIKIPDLMFARMPEVRLIDKSGLPVRTLAHLNSDGTICYVGEAGLPLDLYNPGGSVLRVLREAEIALERSFGGGAAKEYEVELASYWQGKIIYIALPPSATNKIDRADILDIGTAETARYVIVPTGCWKHMRVRSRNSITILWIASKLRYSPTFKSENLAGIIDWLGMQPAAPEDAREAALASAAASELILVISPNALIGWLPVFPAKLKMLQRAGGTRKHFLEKQIANSLSDIGIERMVGIQFDLRSVIERNLLGKPSLVGKKISLIGVGTVGGNLARLLVQSGAGCEEDFAIYDTDVLRPGNLGRHVLGFVDLNRPKATAMADFLRNFHPDVRIKPFQRDALHEWDALERADLIIDATGDYNVATALNHMWMMSKKDGNELAVLHAWVFGNGVAAQTF
jgi:Prokaryotic E2 family B/ThiF family